ncbi:MAG: hypothetical protein ACKO7R_06990 [Pseudanabaena sp.]
MKESVIYQEILLEGKAEGKAQGLVKGEAKATRQIAINMLGDNIPPDLVSKFTGLTLKQVQKLQQLSSKQLQKPKSSRVKRSSKPQ